MIPVVWRRGDRVPARGRRCRRGAVSRRSVSGSLIFSRHPALLDMQMILVDPVPVVAGGSEGEVPTTQCIVRNLGSVDVSAGPLPVTAGIMKMGTRRVPSILISAMWVSMMALRWPGVPW